MSSFEIPGSNSESKSPVDALAEFAKGLKESEGLKEGEIRLAAQIALNKREEDLDAKEAGSPDSELADILKKALTARHGIPSGPETR